MVGVLVEVGTRRLRPEVAGPLDCSGYADSKVPAPLTAPPSGLFLEAVLYPGERLKRSLVPVLNL